MNQRITEVFLQDRLVLKRLKKELRSTKQNIGIKFLKDRGLINILNDYNRNYSVIKKLIFPFYYDRSGAKKFCDYIKEMSRHIPK